MQANESQDVSEPVDNAALTGALQELLRTRGPADLRTLIEARPVLLRAEAREIMTGLLRRAQAEQNQRAAFMFSEFLDLLRACAEIGVAAAFQQVEDEIRARGAGPANPAP